MEPPTGSGGGDFEVERAAIIPLLVVSVTEVDLGDVVFGAEIEDEELGGIAVISEPVIDTVNIGGGSVGDILGGKAALIEGEAIVGAGAIDDGFSEGNVVVGSGWRASSGEVDSSRCAADFEAMIPMVGGGTGWFRG